MENRQRPRGDDEHDGPEQKTGGLAAKPVAALGCGIGIVFPFKNRF
jgi:hypothetical protein